MQKLLIPKKTRVEKAYDFFLVAEQERRLVRVEEIEQATGYTSSTTAIYISKKWWWFLNAQDEGIYRISGLASTTREDFIDLHRQKRGPGVKGVFLPRSLMEWLQKQAEEERREMTEIVVDALKHYRGVLHCS